MFAVSIVRFDVSNSTSLLKISSESARFFPSSESDIDTCGSSCVVFMITQEQVKAATHERFWSKIKFGELNECWEWIASYTSSGYGCFNTKSFRGHRASRFVYFSIFKNSDKGLLVLHSCDNPRCVNPNHLWLGTDKDNAIDRNRKGRNREPKGSLVYCAKLKEKDIPIIKKRLANNEVQRIIANDYGVKQQIISKIKMGKTWKHLKIPMPDNVYVSDDGEIVDLTDKTQQP